MRTHHNEVTKPKTKAQQPAADPRNRRRREVRKDVRQALDALPERAATVQPKPTEQVHYYLVTFPEWVPGPRTRVYEGSLSVEGDKAWLFSPKGLPFGWVPKEAVREVSATEAAVARLVERAQ